MNEFPAPPPRTTTRRHTMSNDIAAAIREDQKR